MSTQFTKKAAFADSIGNGKAFKSSILDVEGSASLFNKFSVFRYHKYGTTKTSYNADAHFDRNKDKNGAGFTGDFLSGTFSITDASKLAESIIENPTASSIIEWSKQPNSVFGPAPYSITDFLYCKYYGIVPNNRLVTLRRFPTPVHDNMKAFGKTNLVPLAQAVTWFGETTKNPLNTVIPFLSWDMPWEKLNAQDGAQDFIQPENVTSQELISLIQSDPLVGKRLGGSLANILLILQRAGTAGVEGNTKMAEGNGSAQQLFEYNKKLYDPTGPKWNEIYGGTNYITETYIRSEMSNALGWSSAKSDIKFHYSLSSYAGIKPKIAMLDIISNFLGLTYMNMEFKGSFERFIPNVGVTGNSGIDAQITKLFFENKPFEATRLAAAVVAIQIAAGARGVTNLVFGKDTIDKILNDNGTAIIATDKDGTGLTIDKLLATVAGASSAYKSIAKKPISMRNPLTGEAVGEWHLVVGNPMNPIATIGNLICTNCTMEFGDELGPDDFPTEVIFTVTLKPGKPRDKFELESMFNLGGGSLTEFSSNPPSSNFNTFGNGDADTNPTGTSEDIIRKKLIADGNIVPVNPKIATIDPNAYARSKERLSRSYGAQYANLSSLPVYFMTSDATSDFYAEKQANVAAKYLKDHDVKFNTHQKK